MKDGKAYRLVVPPQAGTATRLAYLPPAGVVAEFHSHAIGANENVADHDAVLAPAKLFSPYNGWRWYITEWDAETGLCFGLVEGFETEVGYFDLTELAEVTVFGKVPAVERDLYWKPQTLGEIRRQSRLAA